MTANLAQSRAVALAHALPPARRMKTAVIAGLVAAGCSSTSAGPEPVTSGVYHHYATTGMTMPVTPELQNSLGIDLDEDSRGRPDNALAGVLIALVGHSDVDLQARADAALADGSISLLHSVRADDLADDASVSWQVYQGAPGTGTLAVAPTPTAPVLGWADPDGFGATRDGAGRFTLQLAVSDVEAPIALDLIGARVEAHVDATACSGKLGGAVTAHDVDTVLIPTVVAMMNAAIARDPGCPAACAPGTSAALIVSVFDTDHDGAITAPELRANPIIQSLLEPDVDLLDADGSYAPGVDRVADSLSIGVGFTCGAASFTAAGEAP